MGKERIEKVKNVIDELMAVSQEGAMKIGAALKDKPTFVAALKNIESRQVEGFYYDVQYHSDQALEGILEFAIPGEHKAHFLFINFHFVKQHLSELFEEHEGVGCCNDKSGAVIHRLAIYLLDRKEISFNPNEQYTFHHPKKILTTHEAIVNFYDALIDLYYGKPKKYLAELLKIKEAATEQQKVVTASQTFDDLNAPICGGITEPEYQKALEAIDWLAEADAEELLQEDGTKFEQIRAFIEKCRPQAQMPQLIADTTPAKLMSHGLVVSDDLKTLFLMLSEKWH